MLVDAANSAAAEVLSQRWKAVVGIFSSGTIGSKAQREPNHRGTRARWGSLGARGVVGRAREAMSLARTPPERESEESFAVKPAGELLRKKF